MLKLQMFLVVVCVLAVLSVATSKSLLAVTPGSIEFSNGFVVATLDVSKGAWISSLRGDFQGKGNYSINLLSEGGIRLERDESTGLLSTCAESCVSANYAVLRDDSECAVVQVVDVLDAVNPSVSETWTLTLCEKDRSLKLETSGYVLPSGIGMTARSVRHGVYATPLSTTGFFDQGVVQILAAPAQSSHFISADRLERVFFLGGTGAIDIQRPTAIGGEADLTVMLNAEAGAVAGLPPLFSGFAEILVGSYNHRDLWISGPSANDTQKIGARSWKKTLLLSPNNRNFPASSLRSDVSDLDNGADLEAFMTGIYANSVPCLCTYPNEVTYGFQVAQIATTLRHGQGRGYDGTYNYFDPDNFFSLSSILYSGDKYLQNQVRLVVERTGRFMKTDNGQLPHHFNGVQPYYLALSGETQTGPNTFWTKTALRYAAATGDVAWLKSYMPTLRQAAGFVFDLIQPDTNLVFAPGSLMIDVFIRNNYTSDSNAMVVGFLRDFAAAERAVGNESRAVELEELADKVVTAINEMLWAAESAGGDHYITQLNTDGSIRDFVDYDSNLIAIANEVSDEGRSRSIQRRVDAGQCAAGTGGGPQFVSEKYYGPEDTTSGNIGDSWCAMARIGWFDARGRKRFGSPADLQYFNSRLLEPVQRDLIQSTWMHERYGCDGKQQENRTMYYFEYPAYVTMLLREIRYGIDVGLTALTIDPFGAPEAFEYHIGNVDVSYSRSKVRVSVPGSAVTSYSIHGLDSNRRFLVNSSSAPEKQQVVLSDAEGTIRFDASKGPLPFYIEVVAENSK